MFGKPMKVIKETVDQSVGCEWMIRRDVSMNFL